MADAPENPVPKSIMRSYLMHMDSLAKLDEIKAKTGLSHSETVRRSVGLLYDYLILDKFPERRQK
jgi:hypothetical protein